MISANKLLVYQLNAAKNLMSTPISPVKKALIAVLLSMITGLIGGELLLDIMFPEQLTIANDCCKNWKPCSGRKPERFHGRKAVWWCGSNDITKGAP